MRETFQEATVTLQGRHNGGMEQGGRGGGEGKRAESGCGFEGGASGRADQLDVGCEVGRGPEMALSTGLSDEQAGCGGLWGARRVGHRGLGPGETAILWDC